jgi:ribosomal-protein-alanine N-acetyltransferase
MTIKLVARTYVRWLIQADFPAILAIERASFPLRCDQWGEAGFRELLRCREVIGMAAEAEGQPVGYMVYELGEKELRLLRLAVRPDFRRMDVGGAMVRKLAGKLASLRRTRIVADVPEANLPAQLFLRGTGFLCTGVDRGRGTYLMRRELPSAEEGGGQ